MALRVVTDWGLWNQRFIDTEAVGILGFPHGIPRYPLGIPGVIIIHPRDPWVDELIIYT